MPHLPGYLHLLFFGMQTWFLPSVPIFTRQFLHFCDIFVTRKFAGKSYSLVQRSYLASL